MDWNPTSDKKIYPFPGKALQRSKLVTVLPTFSPFERIDYKMRIVFGLDFFVKWCSSTEAKSYYFFM